MPAAADLMADPVGFMKKNIVIVEYTGNTTGPDQSVVNGVHQFKLYSRPTTTGVKRNVLRTKVGVYFLHPGHIAPFYPDAVLDPTLIPAYFCPYAGNATHGTTVGGAARLMFTTQMDGCTFGIGSTTPTGTRLVYHTNQAALGDPNNPMTQQNAQDVSLNAAFLSQNTNIDGTLTPDRYRTSRKGTSYKATTFGVRNPANNTWQFFTQRFTMERHNPRKYGLKEVIRVF